jgi:hypothetical protein
MARYTRIQILALCNDLEADANAILPVRPAQAGKMKAAAMLLRLLAQLADVQEVETTVGQGNSVVPFRGLRQ